MITLNSSLPYYFFLSAFFDIIVAIPFKIDMFGIISKISVTKNICSIFIVIKILRYLLYANFVCKQVKRTIDELIIFFLFLRE